MLGMRMLTPVGYCGLDLLELAGALGEAVDIGCFERGGNSGRHGDVSEETEQCTTLPWHIRLSGVTKQAAAEGSHAMKDDDVGHLAVALRRGPNLHPRILRLDNGTMTRGD